jgi:hypothetical protein
MYFCSQGLHFISNYGKLIIDTMAGFWDNRVCPSKKLHTVFYNSASPL